MNFEPAAHDIGKLMAELLRLIAGMNISPTAKKELLTKSFGAVGAEFYEKMFNDCSTLFDSTAIKTLGMSDLDSQTSRLAQKLIRNDALGRVTDQIVEGYFNSLLADAQNEAFKNAVSLGKVPTLTRSLRGETCEWCVARVGTWTNPSGELFARHDNCDCKIVVSGYKSRNGELKNYTKNSRKSSDGKNNQYLLSDEQAMKKIGIDEKYWKNTMKPGEREFAKSYPEDIKWIRRDNVDSDGKKRLPTNDYILTQYGQEFELKSINGDNEKPPIEIKYKSIRRNINSAIKTDQDLKTRFMIYTRGLTMDETTKGQLRKYAIRRNLKELRIFDGTKEEIIYKKE